MKKQVFAGIFAASFLLVGCNQSTGSDKVSLDNDTQKVSYGIAHNIATNFKHQGIEIDVKAFEKGLEDGVAGVDSAISQEDLMKAMQSFQQQQMAKQKAKHDEQANKNKAEAAKFFADNGKKEGVKTTASGLQYVVEKASDSKVKPTAADTVVVHYRGTLLNGEEFDSSYSRNQPATFKVNSVIPGWTEVLQLMDKGDKFKVYIPSELAYGEGGAGEKIGPNAALVFEIELLDINPEAKAAPKADEQAAPATEQEKSTKK